ncbi:MAG: hypothetical protein HUK26_09685, partial [Duodenibacillus sp.]|nr:hypothetical protein [Duodenibacillus sp.]
MLNSAMALALKGAGFEQRPQAEKRHEEDGGQERRPRRARFVKQQPREAGPGEPPAARPAGEAGAEAPAEPKAERRSGRPERPDRPDRPERPERSDRPERSGRRRDGGRPRPERKPFVPPPVPEDALQPFDGPVELELCAKVFEFTAPAEVVAAVRSAAEKRSAADKRKPYRPCYVMRDGTLSVPALGEQRLAA